MVVAELVHEAPDVFAALEPREVDGERRFFACLEFVGDDLARGPSANAADEATSLWHRDIESGPAPLALNA